MGPPNDSSWEQCGLCQSPQSGLLSSGAPPRAGIFLLFFLVPFATDGEGCGEEGSLKLLYESHTYRSLLPMAPCVLIIFLFSPELMEGAPPPPPLFNAFRFLVCQHNSDHVTLLLKTVEWVQVFFKTYIRAWPASLTGPISGLLTCFPKS